MKFYKSVFLVFLAALILASPSFAQISASTIKGPTEVKVGIYALNVGKFEVATGSYTVDFYLSFKCNEPCEPGKFEFMNGRATSLDKLIDKPDEKFYRIQASLSQNIDLREYPFDKHTLAIEIEDKENTIDKILYVQDDSSSGIDPAVIIVGWQLDGWSSSIAEHYYEPYDETYSRYIYKIHISRVPVTSIMKSFLPVFFMVLITLLTLLIRADKVVNRLTVNISTLLAAVLFHLNVTSSIPPTSYLTFADKFMIITYVVMVLVLFSGILLMRHTDIKDEKKANEIYEHALVLIPMLTFGLYLVLFSSI